MSAPHSQSNQKPNQKWNISESVLDVLISGHSFLDSKNGFKGSFQDLGSTEKFLLAYGYDLHDPIEIAELQGNVQEAVRFIRRYFLKPENPDGIASEIPKKLIDLTDVRELLFFASDHQQAELREWACAILRVVHAINHIDRDLRTQYFGEIQKQIFDRFYRHLHRDEDGQLFIGQSAQDPLRVDLVEFQIKPKKARDSTLMKLLHKPESVAEELFDRVGLRFITKNRMDVIRLIHFLEFNHVIVAANIKPSRSRNTLIDIDAFRKAEGIEAELEKVGYPKSKTSEGGDINRFSSDHYRAIQFTCRQLIKIKTSAGDQLRDLRQLSRKMALDSELQTAIDRINLAYVQKVVRFFYPFEIQAMDHESYLENEKGRSAHVEYKKAQQKVALRRVMGSLGQYS